MRVGATTVPEEPDSSFANGGSAPLEARPQVSETDAVRGRLLVEFEGVGFREVAKTPAELAAESAAAVAKAMSVIREMGQRVTTAAEAMTRPPDSVEVSFGIKLDAEAGALIAKASAGASIDVKLTWSRTQPNSEAEAPDGGPPGAEPQSEQNMTPSLDNG
jgi:hypothetical protein